LGREPCRNPRNYEEEADRPREQAKSSAHAEKELGEEVGKGNLQKKQQKDKIYIQRKSLGRKNLYAKRLTRCEKALPHQDQKGEMFVQQGENRDYWKLKKKNLRSQKKKMREGR